MFDENILLFLLVAFAGFVITYFGSRNQSEYRRYIITGGIAVAHLGIFGILYDRLSLTPFIALVLFVVSVFVLIDPLKMSKHLPDKSCRIAGLLLLFAAVAFFLMYVTGFPVWLWVFPVVIYVMPYTIPSWRSRTFVFKLGAWALVLLFVSIVSYNVYSTYFPQSAITTLDTAFAGLSNKDDIKNKLQFLPAQKTPLQPDLVQNAADEIDLIHNPISKNPSAVPNAPASVDAAPAQNSVVQQASKDESEILKNGPLLNALKDFDSKYLELKYDHQKLQEKYREALRELESLKMENEVLKNAGLKESKSE